MAVASSSISAEMPQRSQVGPAHKSHNSTCLFQLERRGLAQPSAGTWHLTGW